MRRVPIAIAALFALTLVAAFAGAEEGDEERAPFDANAFAKQALAEFAQVKIGMTRAEVEALDVFTHDGGITKITEARLRLKSCPYLKVDVTYEEEKDADGRSIRSDRNRVTNVSKPYLETPYGD